MTGETRILVVVREPEWQTFLAGVLRDAGYVVEICAGAEVVLDNIATTLFDLIIVDALLPDLLRALALSPIRHRLLVVTTSPSVSEAVAAYRYGALDYVSKSFDADGLLATVKAVLQKQPVRQHLLIPEG